MSNSIIEAHQEFERWKYPMIHNFQNLEQGTEEFNQKTVETIEKLDKIRDDRALYLSSQSRVA